MHCSPWMHRAGEEQGDIDVAQWIKGMGVELIHIMLYAGWVMVAPFLLFDDNVAAAPPALTSTSPLPCASLQWECALPSVSQGCLWRCGILSE